MSSLACESPVGLLTLVERNGAIVALNWAPAAAADSEDSPLLREARRQLAAYFAGRLRRFDLPVAPDGTSFQRRVGEAMTRIPYGETRSYEALAEAVGCPGAQRAVGHANGQNRIGIVIPCHRVVNKDGRLGGYGGELWRKQFLLDLERRTVQAAS
jgi:O-6-methylguanine DNA methyltransferase